ncbi:glycosyltransferase [Salinibacter ruber]|jgi:glycosyltransferase involved in cell wall biosynthesis|uniref:glycosyltransferase n=1 Tax=Salinibacter ruber TaxID=146919 RepID=UPI00216A4423|nr:glycosyltransferase family 2 protein [Salinibacter ruber]MCS4040855.1 glycosyltransferase involved in cell wall biosynthesis [Salinibacter ruber]
MQVSVLIPTHNRVDLLTRTLSSLRDVDVPSNVRVEIVVTANACTDGTEARVAKIDERFPFEIIVVEEPEPGQNHARNKCLQKASGEILAFVDDDVRFDEGWLAGLVDVFREYDADVVGGRVKLWWKAVDKPEWFESYLSPILAGYDHGEEIKEVGLPGPVGANVAFHRRVYETLGKFYTAIQGDDNPLYRGNEVKYLQRAAGAGFSSYYAPDALVYHWVSPDRIKPDFFRQAGRGYGYSRVQMKDTFGPYTACRSIVGFLYLSALHGLGWIAAKAVTDTAREYQQLYTSNIGLGGLYGSWMRLKDEGLG